MPGSPLEALEAVQRRLRVLARETDRAELADLARRLEPARAALIEDEFPLALELAEALADLTPGSLDDVAVRLLRALRRRRRRSPPPE